MPLFLFCRKTPHCEWAGLSGVHYRSYRPEEEQRFPSGIQRLPKAAAVWRCYRHPQWRQVPPGSAGAEWGGCGCTGMKTHHCEVSNAVRLWAQNSYILHWNKHILCDMFPLGPLNILKLWDERFYCQIHYLIDLDLIWIHYIRLTILTHLCVSEDRVF